MSRKTVILDRRFVPKGDLIMKEGELGNQAFLVQSGEVRVFTSSEGRQVELARLGVGEIFGEMALIFDGPRVASVEASKDCNLIVISRTQFEDKISDLDPTIRAVIHMLTKRIMQTNNALIAKKQDIKDLQDTSRLIYQNIAADLEAGQKRMLDDMVLPELEKFLDSIQTFQERCKNAD